MIRKTALALLLAAAGSQAFAAISVNNSVFSYTQNFDTLAVSGATNTWANDSTLAGWSLFNKDLAAFANLRADSTATNTIGGFYSFGTGSSTERALGGLGSSGTIFGAPSSGAVAGYIAASFTNNTGNQITDVTIKFDGEQWRNGGNTSAQSMVLEYGFGSSFSAVSWTAADTSFNWASPVTGSSAALVDGNNAGRVANVGGTFATPAWSNASTLWVRWTERNDTGSDHSLAIDNFTLSVTAVPEPKSYAMLFAGLGLMGAIARRRTRR